MKAVDDFDPDKGFAFSTFAVPYIKNAIRRYISQNGRMVALAVQYPDPDPEAS
jgi:DNA-directed RNA polymerase sigma subunit (sigma70/sigma32)